MRRSADLTRSRCSSSGVAALVARGLGQDAEALWSGVKRSISDTLEAILILLVIERSRKFQDASGVVPTMIDLGLQLMSPSYFLIATCALCALVSLASGSRGLRSRRSSRAHRGRGALGFSPWTLRGRDHLGHCSVIRCPALRYHQPRAGNGGGH